MSDDLSSDARPFKPNQQITRRDLGGEDPHKMRKLDNKLALRAQRKQIELLMKLPLKKEKQKKKRAEKKVFVSSVFSKRLREKVQLDREIDNELFFGMLNLEEKLRLRKLFELEEEDVEEKKPEIFGNWDALPDEIVKKILKMSIDFPQATGQLLDAPPKLKRYRRRNYLTRHREALESTKLSGVSRRFYHIVNNPDNKFPRFPVGMKICSPIEGRTFAPERYQVYIYGGPGMKNPCQMVADEDLLNCYRPCRLENLLIIGRVTLNQRLMNALLEMDISMVKTIKFLDIMGIELQNPVGNIKSFLDNAISLKQFEFSGFSSNLEIYSILLRLKGYIENRGIECTPKHYSREEMLKYRKENKHHAALREEGRKHLRACCYDLKPKRKVSRFKFKRDKL